MQLGLFLKRFRKEVALSGESLAKRIGVKRHSLEKWENAGNMPNHQSAIKIQHYFEIESIENISEETLKTCIARELKRLPQILSEKEITSPVTNGIILKQLNSLIIRIDALEKIILQQNRLLKQLEKINKM